MAAKNRTGAIRAVDADETVEDVQVPAEAGEETVAKAEPQAATAPPPAAAVEPPKKKRRGFVLPVILLALAGAGGWYGYNYWIDGRFMISTDDAYIQGDIATISPKVSGYVE